MEEGVGEIGFGSQHICWSSVRGGEGGSMIPIQVMRSSCQESLPRLLPPTHTPASPLDILQQLLWSWPLEVEISADPLVLEREGRAMNPIHLMHRLLPLTDDDLPLLLQLAPGL